MIFHVTRQDIRLGTKIRSSNIACPVARAIRRVLPNVCVWVTEASVPDDSGQGILRRQILLPKKVVTFIRRMCYGLPIKPFSFRLTKAQMAVLEGTK